MEISLRVTLCGIALAGGAFNGWLIYFAVIRPTWCFVRLERAVQRHPQTETES